MLGELKELWKYRALLWGYVDRELRVRYKNSVLGFLWSMLNPVVTVVTLTIVFKYVAKNPTPNFSAYILAAYLPYMFFQQAILDATGSVHAGMAVIKKIYFPREILPLSTLISNFIHLILALGVFFVYLLAIALASHNWEVFQWRIVYLPILLVINFLLATGLGLFFAAWNTFYEDVKYIVATALYLLFFLCPIMYFSEVAFYNHPEHDYLVYKLYELNPIGVVCDAYRKILLAPQPVTIGGVSHQLPALAINWKAIWVCAAFSVFIFIYGYHTFNRLKWKFVERP